VLLAALCAQARGQTVGEAGPVSFAGAKKDLAAEQRRLAGLEQAIEQMLSVTPNDPYLRAELRDTEERYRQVCGQLEQVRKSELAGELQRLSDLHQAIEQMLSVTPDDPNLRAELKATEREWADARREMGGIRKKELSAELQRLSSLRQAIEQMLSVTPDDPYLRKELKDTEEKAERARQELEAIEKAR
jgi:chromosome segregation ATPase